MSSADIHNTEEVAKIVAEAVGFESGGACTDLGDPVVTV